MDCGDLSIPIDQEGSRECVYATITLGCGVISNHNSIINFKVGHERLHSFPALIVHGNSQDFEAPILVLALHLHEPGDLDLAGSAPGCPEIQQHHLTAIVCQTDQLSVGILQGEIGRRLALLAGFDRSGLDRPGARGTPRD